MNKTQMILHGGKPAAANVRLILMGILFPCGVRCFQRSGETYFRFDKRISKRDAEGREKVELRALTDSFLKIETCHQAQEFFERFGLWKHDPSRLTITLKWSDLRGLQKAFRQSWLATDSSHWHKDVWDIAFNLDISCDLDSPVLRAVVTCVTDALAADLVFAALSNLPSAFCARADCGRLFQKGTKHQKKFCSPECAHVESVRSHRARKSRAK